MFQKLLLEIRINKISKTYQKNNKNPILILGIKQALALQVSSTSNSSKSFSISYKVPTLPVVSFVGDKVIESTLDLRSAPPYTARAVFHCAVITDLQNKRRDTASTLTPLRSTAKVRKLPLEEDWSRPPWFQPHSPLYPRWHHLRYQASQLESININRKQKQLAISTAMVSTAVNIIVVEDFGAAMKRWVLDPKKKTLFLMTEVLDSVLLSSRDYRRVTEDAEDQMCSSSSFF